MTDNAFFDFPAEQTKLVASPVDPFLMAHHGPLCVLLIQGFPLD